MNSLLANLMFIYKVGINEGGFRMMLRGNVGENERDANLLI